MSDETLNQLVSSYMATNQPVYTFIWQGGEPTLLGLEFFRKVTSLQQKYGKQGAGVSNSLQTNATLITDELAQHFAQYRFLVGVSLDGPPNIHNRYRRYPDGKGSYSDVKKAISCLRRHRVDFNILTLVTEANVNRARELYRYFSDQGLLFQQYIPCVGFDVDGHLQPYSISGKAWGLFLCQLFDEWRLRDTRRVSIRLFDSIIQKLVFGRPADCNMDNDCRKYFVVEYNGDVYPCDFFVSHELKLGNIFTDSWEKLVNSPVYKEFGTRKSALSDACNNCEYLAFCNGDCPRRRTVKKGLHASPSVLCAGWRLFFKHSFSEFERLAAEIKTELGPVIPTEKI